MAAELSGVPDAMMKFRPQPPAGGLGGGGAAATSGGMPEGTAFAQAERQSAEQLQKFLEQVKTGFGHYASTARVAAEEYLKADQAGKEALSNNLSPLKPGVPIGPGVLGPFLPGAPGVTR
ncbi:hypothetical protein [Amycolatopsis silviterrae]|uniref:PE domain-containing protein n=1 Tax=Amycolatopsis silviterrae TaxID=1656914 RepID=A0ABW5H307_9PSEU